VSALWKTYTIRWWFLAQVTRLADDIPELGRSVSAPREATAGADDGDGLDHVVCGLVDLSTNGKTVERLVCSISSKQAHVEV